MAKPPHLAPLDVMEQELYSEPLPNDSFSGSLLEGAGAWLVNSEFAFWLGYFVSVIVTNVKVHMTTDDALSHLTISYFVASSLDSLTQDPLIHKLHHLGQDFMSSAERTLHPFLANGHGLEFGGADFHTSCFTLHL